MPKPILKNNDLIKILEENIKLLKEIDKSIKIDFKKNKKKFYLIVIKNKLQEFFLI